MFVTTFVIAHYEVLNLVALCITRKHGEEDEADVQLHSFLSSVPYGGVWSNSRPYALTEAGDWVDVLEKW